MSGVRREHYWLGVASLFGVLWMTAMQVEHTAPGPLASTHAQVVELNGRGSCKQCHGRREGGMTAACGECHGGVLDQLAGGFGFHGTLEDTDVESCARCHLEHLGGDFPLVSVASFRQAGFASREAYDHAELDFELQGRHARLTCAECHENADLVTLPEGHPRFLGLDQNCSSCHEDAHEGRIVLACASCHGQEHPFALVAAFEHEAFGTTCGHAAVSCQECHPKDGPHDTELLAGASPPAGRRDCLECHESPHAVDFVAAVAVLANVAQGDTCARCHDEVHGSFLGHFEASPPDLHEASGFSLEPPHNDVACAECHAQTNGDVIDPFVAQVPPRRAEECQECHGDPHEGQFVEGAFAGASCLDCHDRHEFLPSPFGIERHAQSAFPLEASHQAVACSVCHVKDSADTPRTFHGTETACSACHDDVHDEAFADEPQGCAACHQPTLFAEYDEQAFDHGLSTGFVLDGAHARNECETCHARSVLPDAGGRTFGRVAEHFTGPFERCEACHLDPHDGRFDRPELASVIAGESGCARCHTTEDFSTVEGFDHERWTGYPMAEFHRKLECTECHLPAARPDRFGRTFGRSPTTCAECHDDPHVGQFAVEGRTDCARCHQDAGGILFDHQKDSRFPLDEVHAAVSCRACHVPWPLPGGGQALRFKPLGTQCVDCHDPAMLERPESQRVLRRYRDRDLSPRGGR